MPAATVVALQRRGYSVAMCLFQAGQSHKKQPTSQHRLCQAPNHLQQPPSKTRVHPLSCASSSAPAPAALVSDACACPSNPTTVNPPGTSTQPGSSTAVIAPVLGQAKCIACPNTTPAPKQGQQHVKFFRRRQSKRQQLTRVQTSAAPATGLHHLCPYNSRHHSAITAAKVKQPNCWV